MHRSDLAGSVKTDTWSSANFEFNDKFCYRYLPLYLYLRILNCVDELHSDLRNKDLLKQLILLLEPTETVEIQEESALALAHLAKDCTFYFIIRS